MSFEAVMKSFSGEVHIDKPVEMAFPLFSPEGELEWAPGWEFENLYPREGWSEGQVFQTGEGDDLATWVIARLDRAKHEVTYYRTEPSRWVARIDVRCAPNGSATQAAVSYSFVGLTDEGNALISAMSDEEYAQKMRNWTGWIAASQR